MTESLDVSDLVLAIPPIPYVASGRSTVSGIDCFGCALEVQRRLGRVVPPGADVDPSRRATGSIEDHLRSVGVFWRALPPGAQPSVGDIALWRARCGAAPACAVWVHEGVPGRELLLTATEGAGVHLMRLAAMRREPDLLLRYWPP